MKHYNIRFVKVSAIADKRLLMKHYNIRFVKVSAIAGLLGSKYLPIISIWKLDIRKVMCKGRADDQEKCHPKPNRTRDS